jgi:hypothetical protein
MPFSSAFGRIRVDWSERGERQEFAFRNDGVGGSNPSCGTRHNLRISRQKSVLRRVAAVRVFGNSHDFSHVEAPLFSQVETPLGGFPPGAMMPQRNDSALQVAGSSFVQIKRFNLSVAWDTAIARVARLLARSERSQRRACNPHHRRLYGRRINRASSPVQPTSMVNRRRGMQASTAELAARNLKVIGSNPIPATK